MKLFLKGNEMKKGDLVVVKDYSYSRSIERGRLSDDFHAAHPKCRENFVIVETNCVFPRTSRHIGTNHNNTVIQSVDSGLVVLIEERFLRLKDRPIPIREVTMAEVCAQFGEDVKIKK